MHPGAVQGGSFSFLFPTGRKTKLSNTFFFTYAAHISLLLSLKIYRIHLSQSKEEWERKWNVNVSTHFPLTNTEQPREWTEDVQKRWAEEKRPWKRGGDVDMKELEMTGESLEVACSFLLTVLRFLWFMIYNHLWFEKASYLTCSMLHD